MCAKPSHLFIWWFYQHVSRQDSEYMRIKGMLRLDVAGRKPRGRLKMKPDRADPSWAKQCWLKCTIMHSLKEDLKFPDVTQELKKKKTSVSWRVSAHLNAETKTTLTRDFSFFFFNNTHMVQFWNVSDGWEHQLHSPFLLFSVDSAFTDRSISEVDTRWTPGLVNCGCCKTEKSDWGWF